MDRDSLYCSPLFGTLSHCTLFSREQTLNIRASPFARLPYPVGQSEFMMGIDRAHEKNLLAEFKQRAYTSIYRLKPSNRQVRACTKTSTRGSIRDGAAALTHGTAPQPQQCMPTPHNTARRRQQSCTAGLRRVCGDSAVAAVQYAILTCETEINPGSN